MMNRRDFLVAGTAAATSLSAISYARVLGANDRVGLGVIGAGRRGTIVSAAFLSDPRVQILGVCDIYDAQTAQFLSSLPGSAPRPQTAIDYRDLLANKEMDAVLISTPDHLHLTVACAALAAGKHVYLEKPTLQHWDEQLPLQKAVAAAPRQVLQCGTQQRSSSHYLRAREEFFRPKRLGDVVLARAVWHNFPWQSRHIANEPKPAGLHWELFEGPAKHVPYETVRYSSWRYFPDYGNGLLADIMTHWVDVAQWMLDDAQPLQASALGGIYKYRDGRVNPDTISALVQYKDWNFNFESSVLPIRNDNPSVFFEGTEGTLDLSRSGYTFTPNEGTPVHVDASKSLEQEHTANFLDAILLGKPVNAPLQAGIDASLPVQLALRSYWKQKTVSRSELS
jgi:predicted dehydrogenase